MPLSDPRRRLACRSAFVAFGLLPTAIVLHWIAIPPRPAQWQSTLHQHLGLLARIERCQTPTPARVRLTDVRLADRREGVVARFESLEWRRETAADRWSTGPAEIDGPAWIRRLPEIWRTAAAGLTPHRAGEIRFAQWTIVGPEVAGYRLVWPIREGSIRAQCDGNELRLLVELHSEESPEPPIRFEWRQSPDRDGQEGTCQWSCHTGGNSIPAWLIDGLWPAAGSFGPHCRLSGSCAGQIARGSTTLEWTGAHLSNVDLSAGFTPTFGGGAQGVVSIDLHQGRIVDGRVESLYAVVYAPQITLDRQRLQAAAEHLGLKIEGNLALEPGSVDRSDSSGPIASTDPAIEPIPLQQLGFAVEIRDRLLYLLGQEPKHLIARSATGDLRISATAQSQRLPLPQLVRWLARPSTDSLPGDPAALSLLPLLPLLPQERPAP